MSGVSAASAPTASEIRNPKSEIGFSVPVVIVGGGISGLSAAYYLAKAGVSSTLIEKRARLGGVIQTERIEGCLAEGAPARFLTAKPWAIDPLRHLCLSTSTLG